MPAVGLTRCEMESLCASKESEVPVMVSAVRDTLGLLFKEVNVTLWVLAFLPLGSHTNDKKYVVRPDSAFDAPSQGLIRDAISHVCTNIANLTNQDTLVNSIFWSAFVNILAVYLAGGMGDTSTAKSKSQLVCLYLS